MCLGELLSALNCRAQIDQGGRVFIKNVLLSLLTATFQTKHSVEFFSFPRESVKTVCCFLWAVIFSREGRSSSAGANVYRMKTLSL